MHQFVEADVVPNEWWRLNEPPVQRNRAATRARAPTRSLVAHRDATHRRLVGGRVFQNPPRQLLRRQSPQMPLDGGTQIGGRIGHFDNFAAKSNPTAFSIDARLDFNEFAA